MAAPASRRYILLRYKLNLARERCVNVYQYQGMCPSPGWVTQAEDVGSICVGSLPLLTASVLRFGRRLIANCQLRCLQPLVQPVPRMQTSLQHASRQQRTLHRIGRASGVERLLDFRGQAGGVRHVGGRRQEELG